MLLRIWQREINHNIPKNDIISNQRYKLFRTYTWVVVLICMLVLLQTLFMFEENIMLLSSMLLSAIIVYISNYFLIKDISELKRAYHVVIINSIIILHTLTYFSGGITNSGMFYFGGLILTAFILLGNKSGRIYTGVVLSHLIYFYFITEKTDIVSNVLIGEEKTLIDLDFLLTGLFSIFFISALSNYLESSKNIVIASVIESRNELQEKNIELKKLSLVASKTENAIIITNNIGVAEWVNDGFTRLTGYSFKEIVGNIPGELLHGPLTSPDTIRQMHEKLSHKQTFTGEILKYHKEGHTFWIHCNITPILDENGNLEKFIFIESDITAKKIAEQKMEEYLVNLEKTNKELDKFAYVVSHDLKAPLRAIGNLSGWIEEDAGEVLPDDSKENFKLIKGRVSRMEGLINGLLEYSKITRQKSMEENIELKKVIKETLEFINIPENCNVTLAPDLPVVSADKLRLQQVFSNLISNAIKYNDKQNIQIQVSASKKNNDWVISVTDNGPGIDPKYHEKIFVIFQTLQSRDVMESTGVGLAIVKKIIEEQGGKIWVESEPGKGTTFHFTWSINRDITNLIAAPIIAKA